MYPAPVNPASALEHGQRLLKASELMKQGRRDEAATVLRALVAEAPEIVQAHRLLAVALHEIGDLVGAENAFRAALALDPGLAAAATGLSEVLRTGDRADEALSVLQPFVSNETTNLSLLTYFGLALQSAGRSDEAVAVLSRAAAATPDSAVADHNLAGALGDAQRYVESEAATRRAFAKGLDAPETWLAHARALHGQDRVPEAEAAYSEVLKRRPAYAAAVGELAESVWMRTNDGKAARAVFAKAMTGQVPDPALLQQRARLLDYLGDIAGAYDNLVQAIALTDDAMLHVPAAQLAVRIDPDLGLRHARMSDETWLVRLAEEPLLLKMPLVRSGSQLTIGLDEVAWKSWIGR